MKKKKSKKKLKGIRVLFSLALIISIVVGFFAAKAQFTLNNSLKNINRDYASALASVNLNGIKVSSDSDIVNLLLIGNDARIEKNYESKKGLPDVMMIATMDKKHGTLKLTSLMRDVRVYNPDTDSYMKLNESFNSNGMKSLYKTIAENYNIKLDGFVSVGFDAFKDAVNAVGGVEIELTESEANYLRNTNYIHGKKNRASIKAGKHVLNGNQALGYCRIRKGVSRLGLEVPVTPNGLRDDYGRTWRQRNVLSKTFEKMKSQPISKWIEVANKVLSKVTTDLTNDKIMTYMKDVIMMGTTDIHQCQIPVEGYFRDGTVAEFGTAYLIPTNGVSNEYDISCNAEALNQFIFDYDGNGEFKYTPSSSQGDSLQ